MPIDINELRTYKGGDPEKWRTYQKQRFKPPEVIDQVLELDGKWRDITNTIAKLRREVNVLQTTVIAPKKKAKENCDEEVAQLRKLQGEIKDLTNKMPDVEKERDSLLNKIGNSVDDEVPISQNEEEDSLVISLHPMPEEDIQLPNAIVKLNYTTPSKKALQHDDLLWRIDGYEPQRGQAVAGHRGYFLKDAGVLLNQAFINYSIAFLRKRGYTILQPPYYMKKDVMAQLAQLEDFDEQLYKVSGKTDDPQDSSEKYLIATSEQPICGYHYKEWMDEKTLPLRYCGVSTCFRKEAGSSGKDIRGIFRVHQFEKVEQFCVTVDDYEISSKEQKRMLQCAEDYYQSLGFPYRVICLVSGELNDPAVKKYDLEAWFPGQNTYRELVSCSNCTDYQARGVGTRCGQKKAKGKEDPLTAKASYCHLLNSTLCATGRAICCLLENYQTEDGVKVPEVLVPYMGGLDFLPFVRGPMEVSKGEKGASSGGKKKKK